MPTTYGFAEDELRWMAAEVLERWHKPLHEAGVKLGIIMAINDDGDAILKNGNPCFATVRVCNLLDRLSKNYDAEMLIDYTRWKDLTHSQRLALLDHELCHLELKKYWYVMQHDEHGNSTGERQLRFDTDDYNRPKLKLVNGDWDGGDGFARVVERHGPDAIEWKNQDRVRAMVREAEAEFQKQLLDKIVDENGTSITVTAGGEVLYQS